MPRQFFRVNVEISNICNLQCSFCPEVIRAKKLMDPARFREVLGQVAPLTRVVALHLMGDPLVHPKLHDLLEISRELGVEIFLVTNGLLLRERDENTLLHPALRQVSFSLHSFPDNFPGKSPQPYLERIFDYTERALAERPRLFINYRLWNLSDPRGNEPKNQEILRRIHARFGSEPLEVDTDLRKRHALKNRLSLHFDTEFVWPDLGLPVVATTGRCHGLTGNLGVLVDGTVVPCCLDKEGAVPLGNLFSTPLREILAGPRARAMVNGFSKGQLVEPLCQRCDYATRF